ncbi:MAG TPA: glycosyltransferase family 2 protein [Candidatus Saccharimonadales bacterium]|nr:glycosyltransferase family 2 protein [Candidatus Saccharimonadales bacterium]
MDTQSVLLFVFGAVSTLYIIHFGMYLVGANLYDIWQFRRQKELALHPDAGELPLVSVLVAAHNEEQVIVRCLDSIRASSYKNIEVFVVDDASIDKTYMIVRRYIRQHPDFLLRIIHKRRNAGKGSALNTALEKYARGDLVMTLDADSILFRETIKNAVTYFRDPTIAGVAANVQIIDDYTLLGMLQRFEHMIGYRSKKTYTVSNCEFVVGGVASTYRMDVLRDVQFYDTDTLTEDIGLSMKVISTGNKARRVIYAVDVMAKTEGVETFKALVRQRYRWKYGSLQNLAKYSAIMFSPDRRYTASLAFYRLPVAVLSEFVLLLSPLIWGYVLYLTLAHLTLRLVMGAYLTISIYTFVTVWFDEYCRFKQRLHLTLYVPLAYFIFYVMDMVQLIAIVRCMYHGRKILSGKSDGSVWASPQRTGQEVTQE